MFENTTRKQMSTIQNKSTKPNHSTSSGGGYSRQEMPTKEDKENMSRYLAKKGPKLTPKQTMRRLFGK